MGQERRSPSQNPAGGGGMVRPPSQACGKWDPGSATIHGSPAGSARQGPFPTNFFTSSISTVSPKLKEGYEFPAAGVGRLARRPLSLPANSCPTRGNSLLTHERSRSICGFNHSTILNLPDELNVLLLSSAVCSYVS